MRLRLLLAASLTLAAASAEAVTYVAATVIEGDDVPVTVSLTDVAGGCEVSLSIAAGSGTILGLFANTTDEPAIPNLGASDPNGVLAQWQFGPANKVWKVGAGNQIYPIDSWDYGVMTTATGSGPPVESATFTLTGISAAQIAGASTQGYVLGVRVKGTNGSTGSSKMGLPVGAPLPIVTITAPTDGALLSASPVSVTGSVSSGASVTVNGLAATVSGSTFSASLPLADGAHTLTVVATNSAGTASDAVSVTVDTTPPVVAITSPPNGTATSAGAIAVDGTVTDASPIASFTINGAAVTLTNGEFSTTVPLVLGANTITANAADAAGHVGEASITVHAGTPPTVAINSPNDGLITQQASVFVTGSHTGATEVSVGGVPATVTGGTWAATIPLNEGDNTLTAVASNAFGSGQAQIIVKRDTTAPVVTITVPPNGAVYTSEPIGVFGSVADASPITALQVNGVPISAGNSFAHIVSLTLGTNEIAVIATDAAGNVGQASSTVTFEGLMVEIDSPADFTTTTSANATIAGHVNDASASVTVNGVAAPLSGTSFTASVPLASGSNTVTATATAGAATATSSITLVRVANPPPPPPPDPATQAPPADLTSAAPLGDSIAFLYSGANPIQTGVAPGTIDRLRAGVVRGLVMARNGQPLPSVRITVEGHPEFGATLSRADGMFDLAVNAGRTISVRYEREGFLPVQRQVQIGWLETQFAPDVVMTPVDVAASLVDLSAAAVQVARGSPQTDSDGARRATLLIPPGTSATIVRPDGTTLPATQLTIRLTEFTVGPRGPEAMPGELPPTSAYTYAVGLDADEALAIGSGDVRFSQPLPFYLENFLGFPVGMRLPVGIYSQEKVSWEPYDDGRVVRVLSEAAGVASLDIDGAGAPASSAELAAIGITTEELGQVATLYEPGDTLWRARVPHFSSMDINLPPGPPPDAVPWSEDGHTGKGKPTDNPDCSEGSILECQNQTLRENVEVVGTSFGLHYSSDRVPGRASARSLRIPLSGETLPASLNAIELEVQVAGQRFRQTFPATTEQAFNFTWDGRDAYGREMQGAQPSLVRISYRYPASYQIPQGPPNYRTFALFSTEPTPLAGRGAAHVRLTREYRDTAGAWNQRSAGLGGWSLTPHHAYDPLGRVLYRGDGTRQSASDVSRVMTIVAGEGAQGNTGDGGPATAARIQSGPIAVGPDGSLYLAQPQSIIGAEGYIRRVRPDGVIERFAGVATGSGTASSGDGNQALNARFGFIRDLAIGPDGSLFVAEGASFNLNVGSRIRRIAPDGVVSTVIGVGRSDSTGDGVAAAGQGANPMSVAVTRDGTILFADTGLTTQPNGSQTFDPRIRRISTDGVVTSYVGGGASTALGVYGSQYQLASTGDLEVLLDGGLLFLETVPVLPSGSATVIRRLSSDGRVVAFAGGGSALGDGGPATAADLSLATRMALAPDGSVLVLQTVPGTSTTLPNRIRRISPAGIISTYAGSTRGFSGVGGPALAAQFAFVDGFAVSPDGTALVSHRTTSGNLLSHVFSIAPPLAGFTQDEIAVPDSSARELFIFDRNGRHLRTLDALTSATLLTFGYDAAGQLATVTDADANVIEILRTGAGTPYAIRSPYGDQTSLSLDANGYLEAVANPAGESQQFTYHGASGLLATYRRAGVLDSSFQYDAMGRLALDADAVGGSTAFAREDFASGYAVGQASAQSVVRPRAVTFEADGSDLRTNTDPAGLVTTVRIGQDGVDETVTPDGMTIEIAKGPDPRLGMQAPITKSLAIETPGGLSFLRTQSRAVTQDAATGALLTQTDTITLNGRVSTVAYDAASGLTTTTTPALRQLFDQIDTRGRLVATQVEGLEAVSLGYDARGRLALLAQGAGASERVVSFDYDAAGNLASVTDPLLRTVSFDYDDAGRVVRQTLPDSRFIDFTYDARGNLTSLAPPGRPAHVFRYTARDEEAEYEPPDVVPGDPRTFFTYDLDRNLTRVDRPDGQAVVLGYDMAGRLSTVTTPRGTTTQSYSPVTGHVSTIVAPGNEALAFAYDGSLVTATAWSGTVTGSVSQGYDDDFRVAAQLVNGGFTASFAYDLDGLLVQAGSETLTRDPANGLLTGTTLLSTATAQAYNPFGELASDDAAFGASSLYANSYTRDKLGRITTKVETIQGTTTTYDYGYDLAGRLAQVDVNGSAARVYAYDPNGNRLSVTASSGITSGSYDAQDRLLTYGGATFTYNAAGDLASKTDPSGVTQYAYDALGNLIQVDLPDGRVITYVIDGQNRRIGKKVNGALVKAWLYQDQLEPVAELDGAGNVVARFVYGSRPNIPDYMVTASGTLRIFSDHLGSPRLVVNASTGALVQRLDYDEFGRVTLDSNPGAQPFGFAGGIYDADTGLVRFGARDYDAEVGRWTAKDPIRFGELANLYGYALGDPVTFLDLNGRQASPSDDTITARAKSAAARGDTDALKRLMQMFPDEFPPGKAQELLKECAMRRAVPPAFPPDPVPIVGTPTTPPSLPALEEPTTLLGKVVFAAARVIKLVKGIADDL
jgi:RHS repeat-associated protein